MILDFISFYTPIILFFITIILLNNFRLILIYIIGYALNYLFNKFLKINLKDPRPILNNKNIKYNMPSGHAQTSLYSFTFINNILLNQNFFIKKIYIQLLYFFFIFNTFYICIIHNFHTVDQLIIGGIIGILLGYITAKLSNLNFM